MSGRLHIGTSGYQYRRWRADTQRLDDFLSATGTGQRWAVEFRDPDWLRDEVFQTLERHGAALCIHDLLSRHPWRCDAT